NGFERFRAYLHMLVRLRVDHWLRSKLDPSDLVQETLLKAHKSREQFRGKTEADMAAYLRRILANTLADAYRKHTQAKTNMVLERSLEADLEQSSARLEALLPADNTSPSDRAIRHEQSVALANALTQLPEAQRTALELRYLHEPPYSLADIG